MNENIKPCPDCHGEGEFEDAPCGRCCRSGVVSKDAPK